MISHHRIQRARTALAERTGIELTPDEFKAQLDDARMKLRISMMVKGWPEAMRMSDDELDRHIKEALRSQPPHA